MSSEDDSKKEGSENYEDYDPNGINNSKWGNMKKFVKSRFCERELGSIQEVPEPSSSKYININELNS